MSRLRRVAFAFSPRRWRSASSRAAPIRGGRRRKASRSRRSPLPPGNRGSRKTASETPEGGFVIGNPNAPLKLVEYGSLTCPACADVLA